MTSQVMSRWWRFVEVTPYCWNWLGAPNSNGYGLFGVDSKRWRTHRFAYENLVRPIPAGMVIDHKCHNRMCVNPDHLRAVTVAENNQNLRVARKSRSGVRGVKPNASGTGFMATVRKEGVDHYLGTFETIEQATHAASMKRAELLPASIEDANYVKVGAFV